MNTLDQFDLFQQPTRQRLDIQPRDLKFLEALYDLRYATLEHLATLHPSQEKRAVIKGTFRGGQEAIRKRLIKLKQHGYINQLSFKLRRPNEPAIYVLAQEGARALIDYAGKPYNIKDKKTGEYQAIKFVRYIKKYLLDKRTQNKYIFINHELGINTFYVVLEAALRDHPLADWDRDEDKQQKWMQPNLQKDFKIKVTIPNDEIPEAAKSAIKLEQTRTKISKQPDALFTLRILDQENTEHKIGCIYEKDKGSEKHATIASKLLCYWTWWKQGRAQKFFGTKAFRILIETESEKRIKNMIEKAARKIRPQGSGLFWFTSQDNISLENPPRILEPIWTVGHINHLEEKHSLLDI